MAIFGLPNSLYTLFATQNLPKFLFSNALGNIQSFQENLKTILYAKFGEQREGIMGDSKSRIFFFFFFFCVCRFLLFSS